MLKLFHFIVDSLCWITTGLLFVQSLWAAAEGFHLREHYDPKGKYAEALFRVALAAAVYTASWKPW